MSKQIVDAPLITDAEPDASFRRKTFNAFTEYGTAIALLQDDIYKEFNALKKTIIAPSSTLAGTVILAPNTATRNLIQPTITTAPDLILKAIASQSVALLDFQSSAGASVGSMSAAGLFSTTNITVTTLAGTGTRLGTWSATGVAGAITNGTANKILGMDAAGTGQEYKAITATAAGAFAGITDLTMTGKLTLSGYSNGIYASGYAIDPVVSFISASNTLYFGGAGNDLHTQIQAGGGRDIIFMGNGGATEMMRITAATRTSISVLLRMNYLTGTGDRMMIVQSTGNVVASDAAFPSSAALGDIIYGSATNVWSNLPGNITTTKKFLTQTGDGVNSAAPGWNTIAASDLPGSFSGFANPSASVGLSTVNGSATTAMRSDAAPPLSQAITPTWTGLHTYLQAGIGSTPTDAALLTNTTAAAAGAQQFSPNLHWHGLGWKTAGGGASQAVDFRMLVKPVQGVGEPSGYLSTEYSINGAAYSEAMQIHYDGYILSNFDLAFSGSSSFIRQNTSDGADVNAITITGGGGSGAGRGGSIFLAGNEGGGDLTLTPGSSAAVGVLVNGKMSVSDVLTLSAQPILSTLTASQAVFTDGSKGLVSNAITGSGNVMMSASPTTTGTLTGDASTWSGQLTTNSILRINSEVQIVNTTSSWPSVTFAEIGGSTNSGAAYPFLTAGNLLLMARGSGAVRDIVFAVANPLVVAGRVNGTGALEWGYDLNVFSDNTFVTSKFKVTAASGNTTVAGTLNVTGVSTFTAQPIMSSLTASQAVFTDGSKGLVSNAITGTGNVMMSASPTTTGTLTGAAADFSGQVSIRTNAATLISSAYRLLVSQTGSAAILISAYGSGAVVPAISGFHARGTPGSETATQTGDILFYGEAIGWSTAALAMQFLSVNAIENFSATNGGTEVLLRTRAIGSVNTRTAISIRAAEIILGNSTDNNLITIPGTGLLSVGGAATITGVLTASSTSSLTGNVTLGARIALKSETFSDAAKTITAGVMYEAQTGTLSASRVVTLPAASGYARGTLLIVADESGTATAVNTLVLTRAGADTINGATTNTIITAYGSRILMSDGTSKWTVLTTI